MLTKYFFETNMLASSKKKETNMLVFFLEGKQLILTE